MHVKIQGGGGGTYANTGSCSKVAKYLEHEDEKNKERGQDVEPFFNHRQESVKYKNAIKNGTFAQRKEQIFKAAAQEKKSNLVQDKKVVLEQKIIEENIKKNRGLRR